MLLLRKDDSDVIDDDMEDFTTLAHSIAELRDETFLVAKVCTTARHPLEHGGSTHVVRGLQSKRQDRQTSVESE